MITIKSEKNGMPETSTVAVPVQLHTSELRTEVSEPCLTPQLVNTKANQAVAEAPADAVHRSPTNPAIFSQLTAVFLMAAEPHHDWKLVFENLEQNPSKQPSSKSINFMSNSLNFQLNFLFSVGFYFVPQRFIYF